MDWPGIKPWPPFESLVTTCQICDTREIDIMFVWVVLWYLTYILEVDLLNVL